MAISSTTRHQLTQPLLGQDIEMECLKPTSTLMGDIALSLIKLVSSHRGITYVLADISLASSGIDVRYG